MPDPGEPYEPDPADIPPLADALSHFLDGTDDFIVNLVKPTPAEFERQSAVLQEQAEQFLKTQADDPEARESWW